MPHHETTAMPVPMTPVLMRCLRMILIVGVMVVWGGTSTCPAQEATDSDPATTAAAGPGSAAPRTPNLWDLTVQGGVFMIPIGMCSIVVLAYFLERLIGLRRNRIVPYELLIALRKLNSDTTGIDPRLAYDVCQAHPSPLANVVRAAILKIGRPHSELEKTVEDAVAREADEMAHNIRPINVSVSIAPLLGLLGTVQGMILAFMVTSTTTATGTAKGQELAQGIYVALVTTFAGLCVAIPAILIANMLEGRIDRILRVMEDVFLELLPQFERFEGKLRVTRKSGPEGESGVQLKGTASKTAATPAPIPLKAKPTVLPAIKPVMTESVNVPSGPWGTGSSHGDADGDDDQ
jgi:biopolymer transport protein ExbB